MYNFTHNLNNAERNVSRRKDVQKGSVAILKESIHLGCLSPDSYPRKSVPCEPGKLGTRYIARY